MESTQYSDNLCYQSKDYNKIGENYRFRRRCHTRSHSHNDNLKSIQVTTGGGNARGLTATIDENKPHNIINVRPAQLTVTKTLKQSALIESSLESLSRQHKHQARQDTKGLKWTAVDKNGEISPYADISMLRKSEDAAKCNGNEPKTGDRHKHRHRLSTVEKAARDADDKERFLRKSMSRSTIDGLDLETIDLTTEEDLKSGGNYLRNYRGSGDDSIVVEKRSRKAVIFSDGDRVSRSPQSKASSSTSSSSVIESDVAVGSLSPHRCNSVESLILEDNFDATNKGDDDEGEAKTKAVRGKPVKKSYKHKVKLHQAAESSTEAGSSGSSEEIPQVKVVWTTPPSTSPKKVAIPGTVTEVPATPPAPKPDPEKDQILNFFTRTEDGAAKEGRFDDVSSSVSKFFSESVDQETEINVRNINLNQVLENIEDFILQPAAIGHDIQCRVTRDRKGVDRGLYPTYYMHLERPDGRKILLLTGRKRKKSTTSNYLISTDASDLSRDSSHFMGKVRSNLLGTQFTIYDHGQSSKRNALSQNSSVQSPPLVREELAAVIYEPNVLGFKGPRKMKVIIPEMKNEAQRKEYRPEKDQDGILELFKQGVTEHFFELRNKAPIWNDDNQSFVLNFHGRVTQASVKNFQIIHEDKEDYVILQFGRVAADLFTMDYRYPLSALQAFAIVLTSFDNKLACE